MKYTFNGKPVTITHYEKCVKFSFNINTIVQNCTEFSRDYGRISLAYRLCLMEGCKSFFCVVVLRAM